MRAPDRGRCAETETSFAERCANFPAVFFRVIFLDVVGGHDVLVSAIRLGVLDLATDREKAVTFDDELKVTTSIVHGSFLCPRVGGRIVHVKVILEADPVIESSAVVTAGDVNLAIQASGSTVTASGREIRHRLPGVATARELFNRLRTIPIRTRPTTDHVHGVTGARHATILVFGAQVRCGRPLSRGQVVLFARHERGSIIGRVIASGDDNVRDVAGSRVCKRAGAKAVSLRRHVILGNVRLSHGIVGKRAFQDVVAGVHATDDVNLPRFARHRLQVAHAQTAVQFLLRVPRPGAPVQARTLGARERVLGEIRRRVYRISQLARFRHGIRREHESDEGDDAPGDHADVPEITTLRGVVRTEFGLEGHVDDVVCRPFSRFGVDARGLARACAARGGVAAID